MLRRVMEVPGHLFAQKHTHRVQWVGSQGRDVRFIWGSVSGPRFTCESPGHRTEGASSGWFFLRVATAEPPPLAGTMPLPPLLAGGCGMPSPPVLPLFKYACGPTGCRR